MNHRHTVICGAVLACFMMLSTHGEASTSSTSTTKNRKTYGKCHVADTVDMFTDEVSHMLICMDSHITDKTQVAFFFDRDGEMLSLSKGLQFIIEDTVDVAIRVDQGKLRKGTWDYSSSGLASTFDKALIAALLNEIAKGSRVVIKVGKEGGNIPLKGSAAAVADYKARVARSKKLWSRSKTRKSPKSTNKPVNTSKGKQL